MSQQPAPPRRRISLRSWRPGSLLTPPRSLRTRLVVGVLGLAAVVLVNELAEIVVIANGVRAGRSTPLAGAPADPAASPTRAAPVGAPSRPPAW